MINLDPELIAVRIKLGDLYARQKLPAEGRAQYLQAANYYDKKGDVANALDVFRKIADLDPDNLPVRVKLAGMFEKQKFPEKAAEEYVRAAQGYAERRRWTPPCSSMSGPSSSPRATPRRGGGWPISTRSARTGRSWSVCWRRRSPRARATPSCWCSTPRR